MDNRKNKKVNDLINNKTLNHNTNIKLLNTNNFESIRNTANQQDPQPSTSTIYHSNSML